MPSSDDRERVSEVFADAVRETRARYGLSQAQAEVRTGVDRFTISRMEQGLVPRLDIVEKWARGFGEPIGRWRELAGQASVYDGREYLAQRLRRLTQKYGEEKVGLFSFRESITADTPPEVVDEWIERWEEDAQRE